MPRLKSISILTGALLVGHVAGSYVVELWDAIDNYGMEVPMVERLEAPIRVLPWLIRATASGRFPFDGLMPWWLGYMISVSVFLVLGTFRVITGCREPMREARFPVIPVVRPGLHDPSGRN